MEPSEHPYCVAEHSNEGLDAPTVLRCWAKALVPRSPREGQRLFREPEVPSTVRNRMTQRSLSTPYGRTLSMTPLPTALGGRGASIATGNAGTFFTPTAAWL